MCMMFLATVIAAAGQSFGSDDATKDVPALRIEPTDASTTELRGVVDTAIPRRRILLADDALTTSSLLIIDRRRHQRLEGPLTAGVPDDVPHRFQLVLRDRHPDAGNASRQTGAAATATACELVHLNTGKRHPLPATRCRAEPQITE